MAVDRTSFQFYLYALCSISRLGHTEFFCVVCLLSWLQVSDRDLLVRGKRLLSTVGLNDAWPMVVLVCK